MRLIKAFLDSDVIISSLLSSTGAAYLLTRQKSAVKYISNLSVKEIHIVARRLAINSSIVDKLLRRFKLVRLKKDFGKDCVTDPRDQHVISGAVTAKAGFLLTYNLKHFKIDNRI